jgi:hypothetical protein
MAKSEKFLCLAVQHGLVLDQNSIKLVTDCGGGHNVLLH